MTAGYVHLHVHSYYSFFDSTLSPAQIVEFARSHGMSHIALTDTNTFTGIMEFNLLCQDAGITPLLGAEIRQPLAAHRKLLAARAWKFRSEDFEESSWNNEAQNEGSRPREKTSASPMLWHGNPECRAVLIAQDLEGYRAISKLLTRRHMDADFDLLKEAASLPGNVVLLSDCLDVLEEAQKSHAAVYGELIPSPRLRRQNRAVYEYCLGKGMPLVFGGDVKMLAPEERLTHNLLRAMGTLTTVDNLPKAEIIDRNQYLMTAQQVREFFLLDRTHTPGLEEYQHHLEEAWKNTSRIAEMCNCLLPYRQWHFPKLKLAGNNPEALLDEVTWKGIRWRYGEAPSEEVVKRTERELEVIKKLGFTEYFLLVRQIIEEARNQDYFTIGRGSAANSIVTYALGISNVCPVKYNLYFERFLNPDRSSPPDIDLDFSWRERDSMIDWCFDHFGQENVALISTISTLRYRQAVREVAKAHGVSPAEVDKFNSLIETGYRVEEGRGVRDYSREEPWCTIIKVAERIKGFPHHLSVHCGGVVIAPFPVTDLMPLTLSAKGYAITQMDMIGVEDLGLVKMDLLGNRSLGVLKDALRMGSANGGRVYLDAQVLEGKEGKADSPLREQVFQREASRMKLAGTRRGTSVALAGALHDLEGAEGSTAESYGRPLRDRVFDFVHVTNDASTRKLIDEGQTMGCFYIESPGMRALFERLRCKSYEEVVVASSIIRPGVAESGMMKEYIDRHQQTRHEIDLRSPITLMPESNGSERLATGVMPINAHSRARPVKEHKEQGRKPPEISPRMMEMLPETHGVMVYQEDVLKIAHDLAGMSFSEADILRRAISGKMRSEEGLRRIQDRFMGGCIENGVPAHETEEIWRQMASFAGYSFCKGHSAAFAVLSYQVAYLKAHHPAEFFAAVITNQGGFYGAGAYIEEARRWGITALHPCVNESEIEYTGCTTCKYPVSGALPPSDRAFREGIRGWLRPGLRFISGLTERGMGILLRERKQGGKFTNMENLLQRCRLYEDEVAALVRSGACDGFWQGEPAETARAQALLETSLWQSRRTLSEGSLLDGMETPPMGIRSLECRKPMFQVRPFTRLEICTMEREHLGCMISGHPLDFVKPPQDVVPACEIRNFAGKEVAMMGWGIGAKILAARNNGKLMKMLTLEDRTGTFEAIMFPRVYEKFSTRTLTNGPFLVKGMVDVALGSPTLNVRQVERLG